MAVAKCRECGGQVSTSAKACPHCGAKAAKKVGVLGWLFVLLVVLPFAWQIGGGMRDNSISSSAPGPSQSSVATTDAPSQPAADATGGGWKRSEFVDPMTDEKTTILRLRSDNSTMFEFPHRRPGGSYLTLSFRKKGGDFDAYFRIEKGQILCGVMECRFSLRLGDGPVQEWTGIRSSTHESDIMFIRDARQFEAIVKRGDAIRIGIEFYRAGTRVFEFTPADYPGF